MKLRRALFMTLFVLGCAKTVKPPPAAIAEAEAVVAMARARPVPDKLRGRFNIKLSSPTLDIQGSTGGGILLDRPSVGRLDVLGPLGGSLITFAADGKRADLIIQRGNRHFYAEEAETALSDATGGLVSLDDFFAIFVGDLPFDEAKPKSVRRSEQGVSVVLEGPKGTTVDALLDPAYGTLLSLQAFDGEGTAVLRADYEEYAPISDLGPLLPGVVTLHMPLFDLTTTLRFKAWKGLDEVDAAFFHPLVPEGYTSVPLEEAVVDLAKHVSALRERPSPETGEAPAPDSD